jgi:hypothetical protein
MTPRRAIHGQIAKSTFIKNQGTIVTAIDLAQLLSRLLFFDEVIVSSIRMRELPFLIKAFGVDGVDELLNLGVLKLSSDSVSIVTDIQQNRQRDLPLLQFSQGIVDIADRDKLITDGLHCLLQIPCLSNQRRSEMSDLVIAKVLKPSQDYGTELLAQVRTDLRGNVKLVKSILVKENPKLAGKVDGLEVHLEEVLPGIQRFRTNLKVLLHAEPEQEHAMLEKAVIAVSKLNQRIANMKEYNAISLFEEGDAPLLFGKIAGVVAQYDPRIEENSFLRVLEITEIPEMLVSGTIKVKKLLEIRESVECREFRVWLSSTDQMNDAELKRLLKGVRARAASLIASPAGKVTRLAVNTALGLTAGYGTLMALAEGALDSFLLEKLLPSAGALSFLSQSIPSIISRD